MSSPAKAPDAERGCARPARCGARVQWLWPGHIPLGKLTMLDGDPGLGKSLVTLDLLARVTAGRPLPDKPAAPTVVEGGGVLLSAEDGVADTIMPRLRAAGADLSRIAVVDAVTVPAPFDPLDNAALDPLAPQGEVAGDEDPPSTSP